MDSVEGGDEKFVGVLLFVSGEIVGVFPYGVEEAVGSVWDLLSLECLFK